METMKFTKLEKDVIESLESGLEDLKKRSNLEINRLKYTERMNMIKVQEAKILFFKRGILFRERQRRIQRELLEDEYVKSFEIY